MDQLTLDPVAARSAAAMTLASAQSFLTSAERDRSDGLLRPATSAYHEAARLAITALATVGRLRFRDAPGAHEAVLDYALGVGLVDRGAHARLDTLRELRHQVNYPEDFVNPSAQLMAQIAELVTALVATSQHDWLRSRSQSRLHLTDGRRADDVRLGAPTSPALIWHARETDCRFRRREASLPSVGARVQT